MSETAAWRSKESIEYIKSRVVVTNLHSIFASGTTTEFHIFVETHSPVKYIIEVEYSTVNIIDNNQRDIRININSSSNHQ